MAPRILVIEDSAAVRGLIVVILERAGYGVAAPADHERALAAVDDLSSISLVICDLHLAGQSGIAACERLRAVQPGLKILYISGQSVPPPLSAETGFLLKPFKPEELLARVRDLAG
jgi:DNA-binding response OmpR family regulator